jgi:uncharacterized protein
VRVRHHDWTARIEVEEGDLLKILENRQEVVRRLREIGYTYVSLDLAGYSMGSLNAG